MKIIRTDSLSRLAAARILTDNTTIKQGIAAMFARLFADHPRAVNETYLEHMAAAFGVAGRLASASLKCIVHGFVPGLCKTAGSDAILKLHGEISPRRFDQPTL